MNVNRHLARWQLDVSLFLKGSCVVSGRSVGAIADSVLWESLCMRLRAPLVICVVPPEN